MIRNTNDGTQRQPYLRTDLNIGTLNDLPAWSTGPAGEPRSAYQAIKDAGYMGVQGGDTALCRALGLGVTGGGRVDTAEEADDVAAHLKGHGDECGTLHVGWGMESDDEVFRLVEAILRASEKHQIPLYIETHRATITQDIWRTVQLTDRFPEVRFNGDFSHWYTGLEMVYGGIEHKWDFLEPVFERVRFVHGRIGSPGCMQVDIGDGTGLPYVEHFKEMWTRSFAGFLRTAQPGDYICFNPELLQPSIYYARTFPDAAGQPVEESDRWQQARVLTGIAKTCFEAARGRR